ncbi:MAG: type III pantothenate kinase [Armatimonadota bacterium]|nr:type III pantothenate kinase [Armatimonadota bacterium]MCX7776668.1 type III pantothenate kinase [Armatimonadota bacterium]MDW8025717.1 type III pantothenate kinase [Armatimonadota bacterium]
MPYLLAIDVGNTNIVFGLFNLGEQHQHTSKEGLKGSLICTWRIHTIASRTPEEHFSFVSTMLNWYGINPGDVNAVCICSVVPPLTPSLDEMSKRFFSTSALIVGADIDLGVRILYDDPKAVGADRLVNAIAAHELYGGPCIVVDFGTATTFDAITADGAYLGGAIAPGVIISAEALFERTAKLPRIQLEVPERAIGRSTVTSMQSGIIFGYVGLVKELVARFKRELGEAKVIATGGLASMMAPLIDVIDDVEEDLTLLGLRIVFERQREIKQGGTRG